MTLLTPSGTAYECFGRGNTVVLVHGLGLNRHSWRWQVPSLRKENLVIIYDLHGHGESTPPSGKPSLRLFSEQLRELLDHLGVDRAAVLGFSLGGMIARRFAMDHGNRLWALSILHSPHARDKAAHDAIQRRVIQAEEEGPASTVEAALDRWFTESFRQSHPELMEKVRGWILANRKEIYAPIYQVLVDGVTELVAPRKPIACPTLVMTAEEDYGNSPSMSRAIAAEIPNAKLVILPTLRHMAMAEKPEQFNEHLLSFLRGLKHD
jgi:pimeloyl-ACP methyl ester carboxylesterase